MTTKPEPIATNVYDKQPGGTYRATMHVSGLAIQRALRHIRPGTRQELARFRLGQHPAPKPHMLPPGGFPLGTQLAFEKATPTVRRLPTDLSCIEPQSHACPSCARSCLAAEGLIAYRVRRKLGHRSRHAALSRQALVPRPAFAPERSAQGDRGNPPAAHAP